MFQENSRLFLLQKKFLRGGWIFTYAPPLLKVVLPCFSSLLLLFFLSPVMHKKHHKSNELSKATPAEDDVALVCETFSFDNVYKTVYWRCLSLVTSVLWSATSPSPSENIPARWSWKALSIFPFKRAHISLTQKSNKSHFTFILYIVFHAITQRIVIRSPPLLPNLLWMLLWKENLVYTMPRLSPATIQVFHPRWSCFWCMLLQNIPRLQIGRISKTFSAKTFGQRTPSSSPPSQGKIQQQFHSSNSLDMETAPITRCSRRAACERRRHRSCAHMNTR